MTEMEDLSNQQLNVIERRTPTEEDRLAESLAFNTNDRQGQLILEKLVSAGMSIAARQNDFEKKQKLFNRIVGTNFQNLNSIFTLIEDWADNINLTLQHLVDLSIQTKYKEEKVEQNLHEVALKFENADRLLRKEFSGIQERLNKQMDNIAESLEHFEESKEETSEVKRRLEKLERAHETLKEKHHKVSDELSSLKGEVKMVKLEQENLNLRGHSDCRETTNKLCGNLSEIQEKQLRRIETTERRMQKAEARCHALENIMEGLEDTTKENEKVQKTKVQGAVRSELDEFRTEVDRLVKNLVEEKTKSQRLTSVIDVHSAAETRVDLLDTTKNQLNTLKQEILTLKRDRDEALLRDSKLRKELEEREQDFYKVSRDLSILNEKLEEFSNENTRLKISQEDVKSRMKSFSGELTRIRELSRPGIRQETLSEDSKELIKLQTQSAVLQSIERERRNTEESMNLLLARYDNSLKEQLYEKLGDRRSTSPSSFMPLCQENKGHETKKKKMTRIQKQIAPEQCEPSYNPNPKTLLRSNSAPYFPEDLPRPKTNIDVRNERIKFLKSLEFDRIERISLPIGWPISAIPPSHQYKVRYRGYLRKPRWTYKPIYAKIERRTKSEGSPDEDYELEISRDEGYSNQLASLFVEDIRTQVVEEIKCRTEEPAPQVPSTTKQKIPKQKN